MSRINELYNEIDNLNEKLEDWSKNLSRRKIKIDLEIEELEKERTRAGLHNDFSSVQNYNFKIEQLKKSRASDHDLEYRSKIQICKREITDIIVDYYKKGNNIDDIIKLENIPQNIQDEWFDESNFGKDTGFLFVEEIDDVSNYWRYFNPILSLEITSKTLDELESLILKKDEPFIIFDDELANKSKNRDSKIYQDIIDEEINNLKKSYSFYARDILRNLLKYSDKFSKNQLYDLYNFIVDDESRYTYFNYFKDILVANRDKFGSEFINKIAKNIIDIGIGRLNDTYRESVIFDYFKEYAEFFSKNQICVLYNFIKNRNNYKFFSDFNYILEVNEEELTQDFIENIYSSIIDDAIVKLNNSNLSFHEVSEIFNYLRLCSNKFTKNQFNSLYDVIINNTTLCGFGKNFYYILGVKEVEFDISIDNISNHIINGRINQLKSFDLENNISGHIINDLRYFADKFSKMQLVKLGNVVTNNSKICNFANDFDYILEVNKDKLSYNFHEEIYFDIIESRIKELKYSNVIYYCMFNDLEFYASHFSQNQIKTFYKLIKNTNFMHDNEDAIFSILSENKENLGENIDDELTKMKIDSKLDELEELSFGYSEARGMLNYLSRYANKFNTTQINRLCSIAINNSQVYDCIYCKDSLNHILDVNKDKADYNLYNEAIDKNDL